MSETDKDPCKYSETVIIPREDVTPYRHSLWKDGCWHMVEGLTSSRDAADGDRLLVTMRSNRDLTLSTAALKMGEMVEVRVSDPPKLSLEERRAKWVKETEEIARTPGRELFGVMIENGWAAEEDWENEPENLAKMEADIFARLKTRERIEAEDKKEEAESSSAKEEKHGRQ